VIVVPAADGPFHVPSGDNAVYVPSGTHTIYVGPGNNDIYPGPASHDEIVGSSGVTAVVYAGRQSPVTVTLDNVANDGQAGEGDNIQRNVQQIYGGDGGDHLTGDLQPGAPPETIVGGAGNNTIVGGAGQNYIYGGHGSNFINSFNGQPDVVDCGGGDTTVEADASDTLINCRHRASPPRITSPLDFTFLFSSSSTTVGSLTVSQVPGGGSVQVICHGGGCPFSSKRPKVHGGGVSLTGLFRGAHLRVGTQIEVRITKPNIVLQNAIGKDDLFTILSGAPPSLTKLCLPPGGSTRAHTC
jgi:Ca2+-binding RTX toxin-like protein